MPDPSEELKLMVTPELKKPLRALLAASGVAYREGGWLHNFVIIGTPVEIAAIKPKIAALEEEYVKREAW